MASRNFTIDDIDTLFNGDKRGKQFFLINTDGLTKFDLVLDPTSLYNTIRTNLLSDPEYEEIKNNAVANFKFYLEKSDASAYRTNMDALIGDLNIASKNTLTDFMTKLSATEPTIVAKDTPSSSSRDTIDALDKFVASYLKDAWKNYKIKETTYLANVKTIDPVDSKKTLTGPFTGSKTDNFVKIGDKYFKTDSTGSLVEITYGDNNKCASFGFVDGECQKVLYKCLLEGTEESMKSCLKTLSSNVSKGFDDSNLKNMHPELVLTILHRFGFKAAKDLTNNKKYIVSVDYWTTKILPYLKIDSSAVSTDVKAYLEKLVAYVNFHDEILNGTNVKDIYDSVTNKDRFGRVVSDKTNKIAIEGLTRFYESKRAEGVLPKNSRNFITDLYEKYNFVVPSYLQNGGSAVSTLKARLDNGETGAKYLKNIYDNLLASVSNVSIEGATKAEIDKVFVDLEGQQDQLVKYFEFVEKVKQAYNLFKYAPTKVKLDGKDITELENNLAALVTEYKEKELKIAQLIEALAKKELNPNEITAAFD